MSALKVELHRTGGGPAIPQLNPLDEKLVEMLGNRADHHRSIMSQCTLPQRQHITADTLPTCSSSLALLRRTQPAVLNNFVPVAVAADGNSLFRSVSLALYGTEDYHVVLRPLTAAVEVLTHRRWYDASVADCVNPLCVRNHNAVLH